ncbi:MAG: ATP synthase F1 subunit delta, partial [Deltaproteobacteria bacterium GWA2_54_12]
MKSSVAKRFAKAIIEIGMEEKAYEAYGKELRSVLAVFKGNPGLVKILLNPMYKLEERKGLINKVSASVGLSPYVTRLMAILVETRNISFLEEVVEAYSRLEDGLAGRLRASVEAPIELEGALVDEIRAKLGSLTGKEVILTYRHNPSLLGGLVLRIDNTILDGSLKTQLE